MNFTIGSLGADVSFYQDNNTTPQKIDFVKMKAAGVRFVILRGGQNTWVDEDFKDYINAAKSSGLVWGSYWFYDSRSTPASQAKLWRQACGVNVPPVIFLDLEESYGGAYRGEANWKKWVQACETEFSASRLCIYSANWWWNLQTVSDPAFWRKYPLWVAGYSDTPASVTLPLPWRNTQAHLWQWTDRGVGLTYGVESSRIDLNYWNNLYDFKAFWGNAPEPEPPPPVGEFTRWRVGGTLNVTSLNVRSGPGTTNRIVAPALLRGDLIDGVQDAATQWIKISTITRGTQVILPTGAWWCSGLPAYVTSVTAPQGATYRWYMDDQKIGEKS